MLERLFKLKANQTTVRAEVRPLVAVFALLFIGMIVAEVLLGGP